MSQKSERYVEKDQKRRGFFDLARKESKKRELNCLREQKIGKERLQFMNLSEGFVPFGEHRI